MAMGTLNASRLDLIYCPPVARCRPDPLLRQQGAELEKVFHRVLFGMLSRAYEPLAIERS